MFVVPQSQEEQVMNPALCYGHRRTAYIDSVGADVFITIVPARKIDPDGYAEVISCELYALV